MTPDSPVPVSADAATRERLEVACPNSAEHHKRAWAAIHGIPTYKTDTRDGVYREILRYEQAKCDFCWPICPSCGKREKRERAPYV